MNKEHLTLNGSHPEDAIYKVKTFVNELQKVQERYFNELVTKLNFTKEGEDWLFDYIYNCDEELDDFSHYLLEFKKKYDDMVVKDIAYNPAETFLSTDFGEFSPMLHMSSYEADLETAFASSFDNEEVASELDTITIKNETV